MDPTYYSNFSNFFYNNPYQSNENLEIDLHAKSIDHDDDHDHDEDEDDESPEEVDGNDSKLLQFIMKIVKIQQIYHLIYHYHQIQMNNNNNNRNIIIIIK